MSTNSKMKLIFVIWGAIEVLFFAGIIFGWASLVYVYKSEGFFNLECPNPSQHINIESHPVKSPNSSCPACNAENHTIYQNESLSFINSSLNNSSAIKESKYITCDEQNKVFNLIYTLAVVINGISSFMNGAVFDRFGTRVMRIIGMLVVFFSRILTVSHYLKFSLFQGYLHSRSSFSCICYQW